MNPSTPRYLLSRHVFICLTSEHVVLLDARRDEYSAIPLDEARVLGAVLPGWPVHTEQAQEHPIDPKRSELLDRMLKRGLVTAKANLGKDAAPVKMAQPCQSLALADFGLSCENRGPPPLGWREMEAFSRACFLAALELRCFSLERIFKRTWRCRMSLSSRTVSRHEEMCRHIATFRFLRPFAFTSAAKCLRDSFTLLKYLSMRGVHCDLVFGVRSTPFAAHCWLQKDDLLLNDSLEVVLGYTPIMVV